MGIDGYYYCKKLEAVGGKRTSAEKKRFNYLEERESAGDEGGKREQLYYVSPRVLFVENSHQIHNAPK